MKVQWRSMIVFITVVFILVFICGAVKAETIIGDVDARINDGKVEYEGASFRPKRRITTVLFMGIDQMHDETQAVTKRNGGQADFILLGVIDDNAKTVNLIQINRDTLAEVQVLSPFGQKTGTWKTQLCHAHSFGDGKQQSCELTVSAVQHLMLGITIDHYIAMNLSGISVLNDALGGVTVTLKDDFSTYDPTMLAGEKLTLTGKQAEYFVRMRFYVGDGSNADRMQRQQVYIANAKAALKKQVEEKSGFLNSLLDTVQPYITTNMSRGRLINLLDRVRLYDEKPIILLEGNYGLDETGRMIYEINPSSLQHTVMDVFYDKIE